MNDSIKKVTSFVSHFVRWLTQLENYLAVQSMVLVFIICTWAVANAVGRYGFNMPIKGTYDLIALGLIPITFLPWAFVMQRKGFMRLTFLLEKIPGRGYYVVWVVFSFVSLFAFVLMSISLVIHSVDLYQYGTIMESALGVFEWPFYAGGAAGCIILAARLAIEAVGDLRRAIKPPAERPAAFLGG